MNQSVILLLGSNRGDREKNLLAACAGIQQVIGQVLRISSVYETEPWGFEDNISFYNQALEVETSLSPSEILDGINDIEKNLGRMREVASCGPDCGCASGSYAPRTIDIDILFYGSRIIFTEELMIPHPRLHERRFTLVPLDEIASAFVHPVYKKVVSVLLSECTDTCEVKRIRP